VNTVDGGDFCDCECRCDTFPTWPQVAMFCGSLALALFGAYCVMGAIGGC